jgi:hypothetical protein
LERKALKGDVNAAREYREWQAQIAPLIEGEGWLELLTKEERKTVRGIIDAAVSRARKGPCLDAGPLTPAR